MQRRTFLSSLIATAGFTGVPGFKQLSNFLRPKTIQLKPGDIVIAESGTYLSLPKTPKNDDFVQIIVENTTLHKPCTINNDSAIIAGDREPLILDSIANFKLVYKSKQNEWVLA